EYAACSCAVTAGLKFDSVLLAFVRTEFQLTEYDPPPTGRCWPRPTLPDQKSVRTPLLPKNTLVGGACCTLRWTPLESVGRHAAVACATRSALMRGSNPPATRSGLFAIAIFAASSAVSRSTSPTTGVCCALAVDGISTAAI